MVFPVQFVLALHVVIALIVDEGVLLHIHTNHGPIFNPQHRSGPITHLILLVVALTVLRGMWREGKRIFNKGQNEKETN